jgi:hypothetical protein
MFVERGGVCDMLRCTVDVSKNCGKQDEALDGRNIIQAFRRRRCRVGGGVPRVCMANL